MEKEKTQLVYRSLDVDHGHHATHQPGFWEVVRDFFPAGDDLKDRKWWKTKLIKHFLPLGLIIALVWGLAWPTPGAFLGGLKSGSWEIISTINISLIFFLQGVSLKTDEMKAALKAVKALSYAVVAILGITACYGFILFNIPFRPDEFRYGAALFCVVPTTLTSGVLLVTQAGGNSTLALMLTAGTNILGVVTSPFFLKAVISSRGVAANATLNPVNLLVKLLITVLAPCMAGKVLRELSKAVQELVKKHKTAVSLTTNFLLIMIVWMQVSKAQPKFLSIPGAHIVEAIAAMVGLHLAYLTQNSICARLLKLPKEEYRCVVILTSQKTLPVSITIMSFLPASLGQKGLMTIPAIVGHLSQLLIDSAVVSYWVHQDEKASEDGTHAASDEEDARLPDGHASSSQDVQHDDPLPQGLRHHEPTRSSHPSRD